MIVLAEDDAELRTLLAWALELDGHEVIQADSGSELLDEAHRLIRANRLGLIVSDVRMPKLSGLAVLKQLREEQLRVPVVLITGFSDEATRRSAHELGAVLLDKPVQLRTLRAEVARLLESFRNSESRRPD